MTDIPKTVVLGRHITLITADQVSGVLAGFAADAAQTALFCNVHMLMLSQEDERLAAAMQGANYVFADGVPVGWLQRRLSRQPAFVLRGYEAMLQLLENAEARGGRVGFFGSTERVLAALRESMQDRFPGLDIPYCNAPPFMEGELLTDGRELERINAARLDYLFVGLGCPKQEKWIHRYAADVNCSLLGVGAAFEWLAGIEPMPPAWMEKAGLAWLYRLSRHPRRLWRRYLVYNARFVFAAMAALWRRPAADTQGSGSET